jgi:hypothetical protein
VSVELPARIALVVVSGVMCALLCRWTVGAIRFGIAWPVARNLGRMMMRKERLQEYALIAEIIGAIAIVVSLVFVGRQIQQSADETALNTKAIQASIRQACICIWSTRFSTRESI